MKHKILLVAVRRNSTGASILHEHLYWYNTRSGIEYLVGCTDTEEGRSEVHQSNLQSWLIDCGTHLLIKPPITDASKVHLKISLPRTRYTMLKSIKCTTYSRPLWLLTVSIVPGGGGGGGVRGSPCTLCLKEKVGQSSKRFGHNGWKDVIKHGFCKFPD